MNPCEIMAHQLPGPPLSFVRPSDPIIAKVAERHKITVGALEDSSWSHSLAQARQEAMYELRRLTKLSDAQIAQRLGVKHPSTVLKGSDKHADRNGLPRIRAHEARLRAGREAA